MSNIRKMPNKGTNLSTVLSNVTSLNLLDFSRNEEITKEIVKGICDLVQGKYVGLYLYKDSKQSLECVYDITSEKGSHTKPEFPDKDDIFRKLYKEGDALIVNKSVDLSFFQQPSLNKEGYAGVLFVPINKVHRTMYVLVVCTKVECTNSHVVTDIKSLGSLLAVTINNSDLYKQVERSKEVVQSLQNSLKEGVMLFSPKGKLLSINNPALRILTLKKSGKRAPSFYLQDFVYNPAKYISSSIIYFFDPINLFQNALDTGHTSSGVLKVQNTDTSVHYARVYFNRVSAPEEGEYNVSVTIRDVTRYRSQQEQLYTMYKTTMDIVKSDDSYTPLLDVANNAITLLDAESAEIFYYDQEDNVLNLMVGINSQYAEGTKIRVGSGVIGRAAKEHIPILSNGQAGKHPRNVLALPLMKKNTLLGVIVVGDDRKERTFVGRDVSTLVLFGAQAAFAIQNAIYIRSLSIQNNRLESLFKNIEEGVLFVDVDRRVQDMNHASQKIWGYSLDVVRGKTLENAIRYSKYKIKESYDLKSLVDLVVNTKKPIPFHRLTLHAENEKSKYIEASYLPQLNEEGEIIGVIRVTRDISKMKEIDQLKSDFVSIASHELRTPLTVINGYLNLFLEGYLGDLSADQKKFIERIYNDTMDLTRLVEDLLNVSRIEGGRLKLNKTEFDVRKAILRVKEDLQYKAQNKNIKLKVAIDYPEQTIYADERKIIHVISNLVDNAIKYTYKDGEVEIFSRLNKDDIIVNILDNGVGIPLSYKDKIFTKFQRIPNPLSNQEGGTGLGLYISQGIIAAHGGNIKFKRRKNGGSIFQLTIPIKS